METLIRVIAERLSDGSLVYDVIIWQGEQHIKLSTIGESDAETLAATLRASIARHTINDLVE